MSARREKRYRQLERRVAALEVAAARGQLDQQITNYQSEADYLPEDRPLSLWDKIKELFRGDEE